MYPRQFHKKIVGLYLQGMSAPQVGKECGVDHSVVYAALRREGVERRKCSSYHRRTRILDLTGRVFGRLTVLRRNGKDKQDQPLWVCSCECGKQISIRGNLLRWAHTQSCGCLHRESLIRRNTTHGLASRGARTPEYAMYLSAGRRARERGMEFNIEISDIAIPEKCPVLGIALRRGLKVHADDSPSLDRVDSTKGYTKGNICVISHRANTIKRDATSDELRAVADYMDGWFRPSLLVPEKIS